MCRVPAESEMPCFATGNIIGACYLFRFKLHSAGPNKGGFSSELKKLIENK